MRSNKIIGIILMLLYMVIVLCACSNNQQSEQAKTYYIPPSYYKIAGIQPEVDVNSIKAKGSDYCKDVYVKDGGMEIKLTKTQLDNVKEEFTHQFKEYSDKLLNINSNYKIEQSSDYTSLTFQVDKQVSKFDIFPNVGMLLTCNATQQILHTGSSDWSMHVKFVNYNTGKTVAEADLPKDELAFGEKEWNESN